jgi:hypothetical protein
MKKGDNEVLLCQDCNTPLYRWFLTRIDWMRILKQQLKEKSNDINARATT